MRRRRSSSPSLGPGPNTCLIEAHSEHLLLRIMRRMRETFEGDLPDGIAEVRPEHVMVLFVEPDGPHSIVREMLLNERGELVNHARDPDPPLAEVELRLVSRTGPGSGMEGRCRSGPISRQARKGANGAGQPAP